jgi:hypothetical protein
MLADFKGDLNVNYDSSFTKMYDSMFGKTDSIAAAQALPWGSGLAGLEQDYDKLNAYGKGFYGAV